jgi:hypothetical protein
MEQTITTQDTEVKDVEGTVGSEIAKETEVAPKEHAKSASETVPLPVYLELKEELKALKHEVKEAKNSDKSSVVAKGVSELASKYPDVNQEFINDMLASATLEATKKIEAKYSPIIERQENESKQVAFDKAFDNLFNNAVSANPELPNTIDKELVKELAMTPKYRNVPVADIIVKMYGNSVQGKSSSENEHRTAADRVSDVVSFDNITDEQRTAVMADPKSRAKFFDYLDNNNFR